MNQDRGPGQYYAHTSGDSMSWIPNTETNRIAQAAPGTRYGIPGATNQSDRTAWNAGPGAGLQAAQSAGVVPLGGQPSQDGGGWRSMFQGGGGLGQSQQGGDRSQGFFQALQGMVRDLVVAPSTGTGVWSDQSTRSSPGNNPARPGAYVGARLKEAWDTRPRGQTPIPQAGEPGTSPYVGGRDMGHDALNDLQRRRVESTHYSPLLEPEKHKRLRGQDDGTMQMLSDHGMNPYERPGQ